MASRGRNGLDPSIINRLDDFGGLDANPKTGEIAYTLGRANRFFLRAVNPKTGAKRTLVESDQSLAWPVHSPDGKFLAYAQDFDGNENHDLFLIPAKGGEGRNITDHPADDFHPVFSPDGRTLAFLSNRVRDVENIFLTDLEGENARQLTRLEEPIWQTAWHPGGGSLVFRAGPGEGRSWIGTVALTTGKVRKLLTSSEPEFNFGPNPWSPDGKLLTFTSAEVGYPDVGLLDIGRGRVAWLARDDREKESPTFSPDGKSVAFTALKDGDAPVVVKTTKGGPEERVSPARGYSRNPVWLPNGRVAFLHSTAARPEAILIGGRSSRVLVPNNVARVEGAVEAKHIRYPSFDGLEIPALLFAPKRRSGAAVVIPHGGPEWAYSNLWSNAVQMFATRGYVVMAPNYRGSTGYGRRFRKVSDRDLGGGDMRDVNEAARWLLKEGLAEPGRVAIWGVSYGGYLALHCPTQEPDLWAAAVPVVGFFDWETCYDGARTYLRTYDIEKMGDVRKEPELFRPRSPANFLHRLRASVLLFAGANDPRCPASESRRIVERIRALGIPCNYREYPDEGHYPRRASNEVDLFERSLAFLQEHLAAPRGKGQAAAAGAFAKPRGRRTRRAA